MHIPPELEFLLKNKELFNEAFDDVNFKITDFGAFFDFPGISYPNHNFCIILNDPSDKISEILKWKTEENEKKILVSSNLLINTGLENIGHVKLARRTRQKINFPILEFGQIQSYSYRNNKNVNAIRSIIPVITEFMEDNKDRRLHLEKLIGALLHLNNGIIWTYEFDDGNIIAAAIETTHDEYPKMRCLDLVSVRENFKNEGYVSTLIQAILSENWKDTFVTLIGDTSLMNALYDNISFEIIANFTVYV